MSIDYEITARSMRHSKFLCCLAFNGLWPFATNDETENIRKTISEKFKFMSGLIILAFLSQTVYPQENHLLWAGDTLRLEEITIHSYRPVTETGIVKTSIDSLVMDEKIARSLAEVLAEHSPVFIKSYGRGSLATASFRGTSPSHTKVTWNGMEINSPMLGMVDFSLIPVYFADDITLFHGSGSMQETHGALGGLISLNTKPNWSEKYSGRFIQGLGSYGTWDSFLKIHAGSSRFQSGTRVFYSSSDNDFQYLNRDIIDSVDLETGRKYHPVKTNNNAGYKQYGIMQELFYLPGNKDMLKLSFWGQKAERSIPFLSGNESGSEGGSNHQIDDVLRMTGIWKHYGKKFNFQYLNGLNIQDLSYRFVHEISGLGLTDILNSDSRSVSFLNKAVAEFKPDNYSVFHISLAYRKDLIDSYESVRKNGYDKVRSNGSILVKWSQKAGDRVRTGLSIGGELAGSIWSPLLFSVSGEYHLLDKDRLFFRMSFSRNVKFPGMNDLYYQPGGNPNLKSETGLNREAGLEWWAGKRSHKIGLSLNGYYSEVKDWILWLPTFNGYWEPRNVDMVKVSGIEAASTLKGAAGRYGYKVRVDYAYSSSRNESAPVSSGDLSLGKQLPFIPLHSANATFNISREGWSLTWIWNYYSERYINTSNNYYSSRDYLYPFFMNQLSAGKSFEMNRYKAEINMVAHNLFNEEYRSILQRPMPGRNYTLMVKVSF